MPEPTDPPDPFERISRLAPTVDEAAAADRFRSVRRRRTRRRRAATGGLAAAVVIVGVAVAVRIVDPNGGSSPQEQVRTGPADDPASVERDGLRLSVDAPSTARVGTRVWITVSLRNVSDRPLRAGTVQPCDQQVMAGIQAKGADPGIGLRYAPKGSEPGETSDDGAGSWRGLLSPDLGPSAEWDGRPDSLAAVIGGLDGPESWAGHEAPGSAGGDACLAMWTPPAVIEPGAAVERRVAVDLRWGAEAPHGTYEVVALGGAVVDDRGFAVDGAWPPHDLRVSAPIEIIDDPARAETQRAALAAVGTAPTLPQWITHTADIDAVAGFHQRWFATNSWWRGAWETWISPMAGAGHQMDPLRIRWDAARGQVVDVRTVFWGGTPADDPTQPDSLPEPVDEVRYHVD